MLPFGEAAALAITDDAFVSELDKKLCRRLVAIPSSEREPVTRDATSIYSSASHDSGVIDVLVSDEESSGSTSPSLFNICILTRFSDKSFLSPNASFHLDFTTCVRSGLAMSVASTRSIT